MRDLSKFLPTADMQADFEKFQSLSPEERAMFQEERARKMESMPGEEREAFVDSTREGLRAIKNELQDVKTCFGIRRCRECNLFELYSEGLFWKK